MDTKTINELIEDALNSIRPFLKTDGGDVELVSVDEFNNVNLKLMGTCSNCSMSEMTMKAGIEQEIRRVFPEVNKVIAVNS